MDKMEFEDQVPAENYDEFLTMESDGLRCSEGGTQIHRKLCQLGIGSFLKEAWVIQSWNETAQFFQKVSLSTEKTGRPHVHLLRTYIDLDFDSFVKMTKLPAEGATLCPDVDQAPEWASFSCNTYFARDSFVSGKGFLLEKCKDNDLRHMLQFINMTILMKNSPFEYASRDLVYLICQHYQGRDVNWARVLYERLWYEVGRVRSAVFRKRKIVTRCGPLINFLYRRADEAQAYEHDCFGEEYTLAYENVGKPCNIDLDANDHQPFVEDDDYHRPSLRGHQLFVDDEDADEMPSHHAGPNCQQQQLSNPSSDENSSLFGEPTPGSAGLDDWQQVGEQEFLQRWREEKLNLWMRGEAGIPYPIQTSTTIRSLLALASNYKEELEDWKARADNLSLMLRNEKKKVLQFEEAKAAENRWPFTRVAGRGLNVNAQATEAPPKRQRIGYGRAALLRNASQASVVRPFIGEVCSPGQDAA